MRVIIAVVCVALAGLAYVAFEIASSGSNCSVTQSTKGDGVVAVDDDCVVRQTP